MRAALVGLTSKVGLVSVRPYPGVRVKVRVGVGVRV